MLLFSNAFTVFRLAGFDVRVDPSWLLIVTLIVWSLSQGYFPLSVPDQTGETYLLLAIFGALGFFGSLVLHELAHSLVARRLGVKIKGITLFVFGGVAELESEPKTAGAEFWIAIVGPVTSFALAFGFWLAGALAQLLLTSNVVPALFSYLAFVNLLLAVFNMFPAFPMDGGRVYRALLWNKSGDLLDATRRASHLGTMIAYGLIGLGILSLMSGQGIGALWLIFIGFFVLASAKAAYQQTRITAGLKGKTVRDLMTPTPRCVRPDQTLEELVDETMLPYRTSFVPVLRRDKLLGYVDGEIIQQTDRDTWASTLVGDVLVPVDQSNAVAPDLALGDFLARITKEKRRKYLVVRDGALLGVITLADLIDYIGLLNALGPDATQGDPHA